ncbi:hypothetical protein EVAR_69201_1, partial [Eumeta japonica]
MEEAAVERVSTVSARAAGDVSIGNSNLSLRVDERIHTPCT